MSVESDKQTGSRIWSNDVWRRWQMVLIPAGLVVAATLVYGLLLGFRGFGPPTAAALDAGQKLLAKFPTPPAKMLATPHPLFELIAGLFGSSKLLAGALPVISLLAAVGSLPAIWGLGRKLSGTATAICAVAIFALLPQSAGLATAFLPATVFVFLWCWFLRLLVVERHGWGSTALLWLLGAALTLMWPMFLAWGALWLYVEIRDSATFGEAEASTSLPGEIPRATLPIAIVLAPIAVVVLAAALHPSFWSGPIEGWRRFLQYAVHWTGPTLIFGDVAYQHSRPPLWIGLRLGWWMLPALASLGTLVGWLTLARGPRRGRRAGRLVRQACLWGIPFGLILPWIHRGIAYGELTFLHVMLPFVALTAGHALARGYRAARDFLPTRLGEMSRRLVAGAIVAAGLLSLGVSTLRSHPTEGSYYNRLAGGFPAAVDQGLPVSRDHVYPVSALQRAQHQVGRAKLHIIGAGNLLNAYRTTGLLTGILSTKNPSAADATVRQLASFQPGKRLDNNPHALVEVGPGTTPLLSIDGVPVYWLERR